ncbi:response regulator [Endozoicomonas sp. SM1973]|uniref:Sensory/regulatory protein RpfC n=1 Tax=Spartinivicinus marinus TaxID=2994442 RepID=A0A853I164_9GAMM|nr:response regulator [Spartinivicinus marinus]MCX4028592.1 response regulator [Spartinivicinus marinus]NYZ67143.1 response regulator [Spartinivicinus marinus]
MHSEILSSSKSGLPIKITESLASELLKVVFSFYLFITLAVTSVHMVSEWLHAKSGVSQELFAIAKTFQPILAKALWDVNQEQVSSVLSGLVAYPSVEGVILKGENGNIIGHAGQVPSSTLSSLVLSKASEGLKNDGQYIDESVYKFTVNFMHEGQPINIGEVVLFSSMNVILNEVKVGFFFIVVNAVLKTIVLWLLFFWVFNQRIRKPLAELTHAIKGIRLNLLISQKISINTKVRNEISLLAEAFNQMLTSLYRSKTTIDEKNKQLSESSARFQAILDNAPAIITIINKQNQYVMVNKEYERVFGSFASEQTGAQVNQNNINEQGSIAFSTNDDQVFEKQRPIEVEETIRLADGDHTYLLVKFPLYDSTTQIKDVGTIATDITKLKKAEQVIADYNTELEKTVNIRTQELEIAQQKASEANEAKSQFLANISHEIRTPLNAITGLAYLALKTRLSPKQKDYLNKIQSASQVLLGIINNTLDMSKIEAGKLAIESANFSLRNIVKNIEQMFTEQMQEKGLLFIVTLNPDIPDYLIGDALRLQQVFINLVNNAMKFTDSGTVSVKISEGGDCVNVTQQSITSKQVNIAVSESNPVFIRFCVKDTGIGIEESKIDSLFESFTQAEAATTRRYGGTGLGLAISRQLVELMGGVINVKSQLGCGSEFIVEIPFNLGYVPSQPVIEPNNPFACRGCRILVVEDNRVNQQVISELLNQVEIDVSVANNGSEAVAMLSCEYYQLVLMDIQMPGMSGYQTARKIRELPELKDVPIIALTSNALDSEREKATQAGMNDFLTKPIDPLVFYNCLSHWLKGCSTNSVVRLNRKTATQYNPIPDDLPGINTQVGIYRIKGNQLFYNKILNVFYTDHYTDGVQIKQLIEQKNFISAQKKLHALKGAAANIGADKLVFVATKLEKCCEQLNCKEQDISDFIEEHDKLIVGLYNWAGLESVPKNNGLTDTTIDRKISVDVTTYKKITVLRDSLSQHAFCANQQAVEIKSEMPTTCADVFEKLILAITAFDFDQALNIIDNMIKKLEVTTDYAE